MGRKCASCRDAVMFTSSVLEKWKNALKVLPSDGVFSQGTGKPDDESWLNIPVWSPKTVSPWIDTGESFSGQLNPYDMGPNVDEDLPTVPPIHFNFDNPSAHHGLWGEDSSKGVSSYTWITMAVVLVVFFKVTVIAVMIARRMRYRQHRLVVRSTSSNSVTIPSEFTSDQAHLVTPANIVYVDTDGQAPPPLPQLFTPPPYCESLMPNSQADPATPDEEPPPYSN
ncbi:uncharacterized protein LOC110988810 isoform X2 [Acanthaster planci]|uniref:Uncharacterized protein LOC110988810 isoform X2 n=1 Tax=Acanthaster planci TaxID=133434 RepID=A0A8B7ZSI2_ACAPL|nr:uncharacterized protein LOC110988810 isoform X2 [Acanthaster planci]